MSEWNIFTKNDWHPHSKELPEEPSSNGLILERWCSIVYHTMMNTGNNRDTRTPITQTTNFTFYLILPPQPEWEYNKIHITCNYSRNSLFPPNSLTTTITTAKIANDIITRIIVPMGSTLICGTIQKEIPKTKTANIIIIIIQPKGVGFFHLFSLPIFLTSIIFHS